jgi:hypothetical protein
MSDFGHVGRGDRLRLPAHVVNGALEAGRRVANQRDARAVRAAARPTSTGEVLVRNDAGVDLPRYAVLAIAGVAEDPVDGPLGARPLVIGAVPADGHRNFVVTQEPIRAGAIGLAVASGFTRVAVTGSINLKYAEMAIGSTSGLVRAERGQAEVLTRNGEIETVKVDNTWTQPTFAFAVITGGVTPNGVAGTTYLAQIHGPTVASLFATPEETNVTVHNPDLKRHWYGEVVALDWNPDLDRWEITKFLERPEAYSVTPGQIGLRMVLPQVSTVGAATPSVMTLCVVDLAALNALNAFDDGANLATVHVIASFGSYIGIGNVGVQLSSPIRLGATAPFSVVHITEDFAEATEYVFGSSAVATVASAQDTVDFSLPQNPSAGELDPAIYAGDGPPWPTQNGKVAAFHTFEVPDTYAFPSYGEFGSASFGWVYVPFVDFTNQPGEEIWPDELSGAPKVHECLALGAGVTVHYYHEVSAPDHGGFPGIPAFPGLPSLQFVVFSPYVLLAHARAVILPVWFVWFPPTTVANKLNPMCAAMKPMTTSERTLAGSYTAQGTTWNPDTNGVAASLTVTVA